MVQLSHPHMTTGKIVTLTVKTFVSRVMSWCFNMLSRFVISCYYLIKRSSFSCDSMDCSLPGSSVHGISQARLLEWVSISFSRGSSWPRHQNSISCLAGGFFTTEKSAAAAAAKSLQSCLTLCDPIDGSPPGSPVPGILHWSGLPFPSPVNESKKWKWSRSVVSNYWTTWEALKSLDYLLIPVCPMASQILRFLITKWE